MKIFSFIFVSIMFYWMYCDAQTWYNDYKTIFIPTMQSECSSNYILKMMQKIYENHQKVNKMLALAREHNFTQWTAILMCGEPTEMWPEMRWAKMSLHSFYSQLYM